MALFGSEYCINGQEVCLSDQSLGVTDWVVAARVTASGAPLSFRLAAYLFGVTVVMVVIV
jgi:hypothetical protein